MIENLTTKGIGCFIVVLCDRGINAFTITPLQLLESISGRASYALLPSIFIPRSPGRGPAAARVELVCVWGPGVTFIPKNFAATGS